MGYFTTKEEKISKTALSRSNRMRENTVKRVQELLSYNIDYY